MQQRPAGLCIRLSVDQLAKASSLSNAQSRIHSQTLIQDSAYRNGLSGSPLVYYPEGEPDNKHTNSPVNAES